ncbi:MAG: PilZ domain-containing protein [Syntrophobacteraceae bacterium]|jgi:hypothetical protein|nr:PilZ domain-containing protein [Syntrophobacteraceae bacterium]
MDEKRNFTRVLFRGEAALSWENKVIRGQLGNLSLRGMLVKSVESLPVGVHVDVQIQLAGSTSEVIIRLLGRVTRQEESALAVEITGMDLDSFVLLKNIILHNSEIDGRVMEEFSHYMESTSGIDG